jgi:glycosyltransferase involved in cell wall biosynthesis
MVQSRSNPSIRCDFEPKERIVAPSVDTPVSGRVRIAYVLTALCEGGLERFTLELGRRLDKERFEPVVFSLTPLVPWSARFQEEGIPVFVYQARNRLGIASLWPNLRTILQLSRDFRRQGIRIVHTCDFYPATMGRLAAFLARVPGRVHTLHSLYDWYPGWAHRINQLLALRTHQVTAVSNPVLESSARLDKLPTDKYMLVHNGADPLAFHPDPLARAELRKRLGLPETARIVASVGAYTERKGHRTVAKAILPLLGDDPDLHLAIFGTVPEARHDIRPDLERMFQEAGFPDRLHMPGPVDDVRTVYCGCDIFCMASHVEGLSLAGIEAQMCGALSLFSDIPSFREIVEEGQNGFLFPVGDADALRRTIRHALALSPEKADALRKSARTRAVERFHIDTMVGDYQAIYEDVLGSV